MPRFRAVKEQRAIAHILGTLDDKVELNRRMNETLEAMARALFKSWFVDFDPVRAKAEGRDSGLPKPLADFFPDLLRGFRTRRDSGGLGGGTIWRCSRTTSRSRKPTCITGGLVPPLQHPAFDQGQWQKPELGESIKSSKLRVPPGVILLSKLNPEIERVWLVDVEATDRAVCSTEFLVLRPRSPFGRSYTYCLTRSPFFRQQIEALVTGTSKSHQRAQVDAIMSLSAILPPKPVADAFDKMAAHVWIEPWRVAANPASSPHSATRCCPSSSPASCA